jgi:hypothetical protein
VHSIRSLKKQYEPKKVAAAVIDEVGDRTKKVVKSYLPTFSRWGKKITGVLKKKVFSTAAARLYEFGKNQQLKETKNNQWADPLKVAAGYQEAYYRKDSDGVPVKERIPVMHRQVVQAGLNKANVIRKTATRGGALAKDGVAVLRGAPREVDANGRKKKREWEKSWFQKAATNAAIAGGILVGARHIKRNPGGKVDSAFRKGSTYVKEKVNKVMPDTFDMSAQFSTPASRVIEFGQARLQRVAAALAKDGDLAKLNKNAIKLKHSIYDGANRSVKKKMGFVPRWDPRATAAAPSRRLNKEFSTAASRVFNFDDVAYDAGWDVRDPRGRSARVFAPGAGKRDRRDKRWHEKAENERKLWKGAVAAAAVAGLVGGRSLRKGGAAGKAAIKVPGKVPPTGFYSRTAVAVPPTLKVDRN